MAQSGHRAACSSGSNGAVSLTLADGPTNERLMETSRSLFILFSKETEEMYTHKALAEEGE